MFYPHPNWLDPYLGRGLLGHRYRRAYPGASEPNLRQSYYDLFPGDKSPERFLLAEAKHLTGGTVVVECEPTARFGSEDILFDHCQSISFGGGAFRLLAMNTQRDRFRTELGQVTVRSIEVVGAQPGVSAIKMAYVMTDRSDGEPVTLEFRLRSSGPVPKKMWVADGRLWAEIDFADTLERDRYYWLVVQDSTGNHRVVGAEDLRGLFVPYLAPGEHGAEP